MRYFINLSYLGTSFHGWQCQPNAISVQEVLEKALTTVLRSPIKITGAGRTDTGVHARLMVAHFDAEIPVKTFDNLVYLLSIQMILFVHVKKFRLELNSVFFFLEMYQGLFIEFEKF